MTNAIAYIISNCIPSEKNKILVICDSSTEWIIEDVRRAAEKNNRSLQEIKIDCTKRHGEEPSEIVLNEMLLSDAILCITRYSLAHTNARREAEKRGIPFLSMPDYDQKIIANEAMFADYSRICDVVDLYADMLSRGHFVTVKTDKGTELFIDITERKGNSCPGMTDPDHLLGSPPDIEANISLVETYTHGKIIVDGSITDRRIGLLSEAVELTVEHGAVVKIDCVHKETRDTIRKIFADVGSPNAYVIGELGIGFNDKAELCGNMLIDEGAKGCVHFGIGSNWTIGGANKVDFHLDFVIRNATVEVDGEKIIEKGQILYG